jgi:MFS family permease
MTALRRPDFRRLWAAGLISDVGDWLLLVSLPILVFELTGSTLGTAFAFLIELAPPVLLAPIAGIVADRYDRRRTLLIVSALQAIALLPLLAVHGRPDLPIVYAVIALESALAALFDPAKNAYLPTLVEPDDLVSANALIGLNQNLGRLVGGPIGGLLLVVGELSTIVAVDAVSFVIAALLIAGVRRTPTAAPATAAPTAAPAPAAPSEDASTAAGSVTQPARLSDALAKPAIRGGLIVLLLTSVAQGIFVVLYVVFVARVLHGDAAETGLIRGVQAIGAIVAGLVVTAIGRRLTPGWMTALGSMAFGLIALATWNAPALSRAEPIYVALFIVVGAPGLFLMTGLLTTVQTETPAHLRGRVFAAFGVAAAAGQAVGMLASGLLGDKIGVVTILNVQACFPILAGVVAARTMVVRKRPALAAVTG